MLRQLFRYIKKKKRGVGDLTVHLGPEELNEGLREGLDPLVHDVVALLDGVLVVPECDVLLLVAGIG